MNAQHNNPAVTRWACKSIEQHNPDGSTDVDGKYQTNRSFY
jgi:hypothetical protein